MATLTAAAAMISPRRRQEPESDYLLRSPLESPEPRGGHAAVRSNVLPHYIRKDVLSIPDRSKSLVNNCPAGPPDFMV